MPTKRSNDFLNGVPELLLLHALDQRAQYGYELVQSIRLNSQQALEFGEGSIYPILHRLESDGCLTSQRKDVGGRQRVVYAITAKGRKRLAETQANWKRVTQAILQALEGGPDAQPALA